MKVFLVAAMTFASGLCGQNACGVPPVSVKPITPIGCSDTKLACSCRGINDCNWVWVCTDNSKSRNSDLDSFLEAQRNGQRVERQIKDNELRDRELKQRHRQSYKNQAMQQDLEAWAKGLRDIPPKAQEVLSTPDTSEAENSERIERKTQTLFDGMEALKASIAAQESGVVTNALSGQDRDRAGLYKLTAAEVSSLNDALLKLLQSLVDEARKSNPKP